ncbi:ABC transporter ATP-binding protein [Palleronia caenipelagi]|uniref:ABC transporter ATP-binding protein n=1 Tax=Palleronia caenipelagi TaxID=2489174 RepID=A0A547Q570_9RHOB|nr:ABC transporter ATP-binding protein [Palleronia caenipelagi]TRD21524.1 ABC transporter ATP-binding protein [Palleronia caenipelagi]
MATAPRLEIENLHCAFGGVEVVQGISLTVEGGDVLCLLGPSGCGKSTTLRTIAGLEDISSGEIRIDGQVVTRGGYTLPPEHRGVGLIFQDFALFPHLTVAENISYGLRASRSEKAHRVDELLERVHLSHHRQSYAHELSGGEQQRVALARALAPRPRVMLMDEPFSGLDNRLRDGIRDHTLQVLKDEDTAVVLVTHEPEEAMRMADQIALMRNGSIVQQGAPYNIYNSPADRAAAAFFSDINVIEAVVNGALAETPFGQFLAPGQPDGTKVDIVIRPQHLRIDFDRAGQGPHPTSEDGTPARAEVIRSRFVGKESLVEFLVHEGLVMTATVPNVFLPKPGTVMWLAIRRDRCFVFPRKP